MNCRGSVWLGEEACEEAGETGKTDRVDVQAVHGAPGDLGLESSGRWVRHAVRVRGTARGAQGRGAHCCSQNQNPTHELIFQHTKSIPGRDTILTNTCLSWYIIAYGIFKWMVSTFNNINQSPFLASMSCVTGQEDPGPTQGLRGC